MGKSFSNQITNRTTAFQIESLHLKSNRQNGPNRDLNPNRNWDLPITEFFCPKMVYSSEQHNKLSTFAWNCSSVVASALPLWLHLLGSTPRTGPHVR